MMKRFSLLVASLSLLFFVNACGTKVAPWERGHLAKPHMALEPNPLEASIREHIYTSKEASSGGYASGGGGCGCN